MDNSQLFLSGAPFDPGRPVEPGGPIEPSSDDGGLLSTAEKAYGKQLTIHTAKPFIHCRCCINAHHQILLKKQTECKQ